MSAALDTQDNVTQLPTVSKGARKAAIALLMLGNDLAGELMRGMSDHEVELLIRTANTLKTISPEEAEVVLAEFTAFFSGQTLLVPRPNEFVRTAAEEALGMDRVRLLLGDDVVKDDTDDVLAETMNASPDALASVLKKEHPQTVAVALAVMQPKKAALVMSQLPAEERPELIRRIAQMKSITPSLLREISDTLRRELDSSVGSAKAVDGEDCVVNLLKALDSDEEAAIFEGLNETDAELSEAIRKKMFIFDDLLALDPRGLQMMLKEIDGRTLTLSLKTASSALRDHMLSAMSSRAATMIIEDLEAMGPVSVSQVEQAQDEIVGVALRLASEGKIVLR